MMEWLSPLTGKLRLRIARTMRRAGLVLVGLMPVVPLIFVGPVSAGEDACRPLTVDNADYVICTFDPAKQPIRMAWRDSTDTPYGGLTAYQSAVTASGEQLVFAMNGGMYRPDLRPVGLYIENGQELFKLSTSCGKQNFNLCPNGVFLIRDGKASVMETRRYRREKPSPDHATQSGPMLVIDGKLHPKFRPDSDSRKIRNGVGVRADGAVVFAISSDYVTFYQFASLFRDSLETPNALFLDGTISSLNAPSINRADSFWPVGPIISVVLPPSAQSGDPPPLQ
jgi:uncharacterized protein YigE (DUF2233 family)